MIASAGETRKAILAAMREYKATVLDRQFFNEETGRYDYPYRISKSAVLRLAGIQSRSTLRAEYHADLACELEAFIETLKQAAGKPRSGEKIGKCGEDTGDTAGGQPGGREARRLETMAQTIIGLRYKLMAVEQELADYKTGRKISGNVTSLRQSEK